MRDNHYREHALVSCRLSPPDHLVQCFPYGGNKPQWLQSGAIVIFSLYANTVVFLSGFFQMAVITVLVLMLRNHTPGLIGGGGGSGGGGGGVCVCLPPNNQDTDLS